MDMNILINYADENFRSAQRWNTITGKILGHFSKVYEFGPSDIDESFRLKHADIFAYKRGNGLWLWKPYFIEKVIRQCDDGDYVFYLDSGAFFIRNPRVLYNYIDEEHPIFACDQPLIESCWTKPECFDYLNCWEFSNFNQFLGGIQIILVNPFTRKFYKEWLDLCCQHDLISPAGLGKKDVIEKNYGNSFVSHREDQSLFSLLCHKYGIRSHRDITQRGYNPMSFYNPKYAFRLVEHPDDNYKTIVFLHKSESVSMFILKKIYSSLGMGKLRRKYIK